MIKKTLYVLSALVLLVALAACSTIQSVIGGGSQAQTNNQTANGGQPNGRGGFGGDPATMTVEQKMGFAILKMEGTPTGLTAQQAKDMLPLWQALKSMETSNTASADEITAIFTQMKDTLTPEQVAAVTKLTWTQEDMTATMQQYGMQIGGPGGAGGTGTLTTEQQATRTARFANGGNNRQGGQGGPGGGAPPDGGPGGQGGFGGNGGQGGNNTTGGATRTPSPAQLHRRAIGLNSIFINPVITLLTTKAGK